MSDNNNNAKTMYEAVPAAAELNKVPGFDPLKFLRRAGDSMKLDLPYLCLSVEKRPLLNDTTAQMRRTSDGWTLTAHGLIRYEDGTIEWNYSTGGRWSESK